MTLFLLKMLRSFYKLLISETAPLSIAAGFAAGVLLGFTPLLSPHNLLLAMVIMLLRVNLSAALFSMALFKLVGIPLWGAFHELGWDLLNRPGLEAVWRSVPGFDLLRLNNTQVLGSLAVSLLVAPVVLLLGLALVRRARALLTENRANHWFVRFVNRSRVLSYLAQWA